LRLKQFAKTEKGKGNRKRKTKKAVMNYLPPGCCAKFLFQDSKEWKFL